MKPTAKNHKLCPGGFTLTELLIVIVIIAVLAALIFSATGRARDSARSAKCMMNLRGLGSAALTYASENNGRLPPLCELDYGRAWSTQAANRWWMSFLSGSNAPASELVYNSCRCPEAHDEDFQKLSEGLVYSSYSSLKPVVTFITQDNPNGSMRLTNLVNPAKVWMFGDGGKPITGGDANRYTTVAAIERYGNSWASANRPAFRHKGGTRAHYVACDGHVESLTREEVDNLNNGAFGVFNGSKVEY